MSIYISPACLLRGYIAQLLVTVRCIYYHGNSISGAWIVERAGLCIP